MRHGEYENIGVTEQADVLVIELSRPARRNAMSLDLRRELTACLLAAEANDKIRALVITGEGEKAFSAGADIEELQQRTSASELARGAELRRELPRVAETLSKPTVAAINGLCLGAGLEFAIACTVRIACESAKLGLPEINLGVIPGSGGTQRLSRLIGMGRAMEMTITGLPISATRAEQIGLVSEAVPDDALMERAVELARLVGSKPQVAFVSARDAVLRSPDLDLTSGLEFERRLFALCVDTDDKAEAVDAFLTKRKPTFRNH